MSLFPLCPRTQTECDDSIPVIVGIIVALGGFAIPKIFEKGSQISYSIDGPVAYVDSEAMGSSKITVDGVQTPNIYGYKVRIWNSGGRALQSLPGRFDFETKTPDFKIFNVTHETTPKREFGSIKEDHTE